MNILWNKSFCPGEATRGQYSPIDLSTLTPTYSGRGRYAVLTYQIGSESNTPSSANYSIEIFPNTTYNMSSSIAAGALYTVTFPALVNYLEVYVNSGNAYLALNDGLTTFTQITANGMPLKNGTYYNNHYETTTLKIASTITTDLRVFGNYRTI